VTVVEAIGEQHGDSLLASGVAVILRLSAESISPCADVRPSAPHPRATGSVDQPRNIARDSWIGLLAIGCPSCAPTTTFAAADATSQPSLRRLLDRPLADGSTIAPVQEQPPSIIAFGTVV